MNSHPAQPKTADLISQDRFELVTGETPLAEGMITYLKSSLNTMVCHTVLSNYRIVACKKSWMAGMVLFGPVGLAVSLARKQTKITFQIPIAEIVEVNILKHGFTQKYRVLTRSEKNYDLIFTHPEEWECKLKSLGVIMKK